MSYFEPPSSLEFFNTFISNHPQLSLEEEQALVRRFRFAYDTKMQLIKERDRVRLELALSSPGLQNMFLVQELEEIQDLLKVDPQIKRIPYYRNKLIEHNLRLIIKVASHYKAKGLPMDDLIQEGTLGFVRAIEKFDPREGVKLGTYAVWWIRQKITRALSNKTRIIRLPVHVTAQVTKVLRYIKQNQLDVDEKYVLEIALALDMREDKVKEIFMHIMGFSPANQVVVPPNAGGEDEHLDSFTNLMDMHCNSTMSIDSRLDLERIRRDMNFALSELTKREQKLLSYKYGLNGEDECSYVALEKRMELEGEPVTNGKLAVQSALHSLLKAMLSES